jgi:hypothetical protein
MSFLNTRDSNSAEVHVAGGQVSSDAAFSQYESTCRSHFKWWGCGAVKIEIVDIDRFNEDIFMGEVLFRISTILYIYSCIYLGYSSFVVFAGTN